MLERLNIKCYYRYGLSKKLKEHPDFPAQYNQSLKGPPPPYTVKKTQYPQF